MNTVILLLTLKGATKLIPRAAYSFYVPIGDTGGLPHNQAECETMGKDISVKIEFIINKRVVNLAAGEINWTS